MNFEQKKSLIEKYFSYVDEKNIEIFNLYTEDVEIFFSKFGQHRGIKKMKEFSERMSKVFNKLEHDMNSLLFIDAGDKVIVEGNESGEMYDGQCFPDYKISQGKFCNIFEFKDNLISSVKIYVDPDFVSADQFLVTALYNQE